MNAPRTTTITTTFDVTDETLWGIFVTALEGGIGYWSICSSYRPWVDEASRREPNHSTFHALVLDTVEHQATHAYSDDPRLLCIDRDVILKGVTKALSRNPGVADRIVQDALREVRFGDGGYLDAEGADAIVQLGVFGRIVYG